MADNDNGSQTQHAPGALPTSHGLAALLLVESLIHGLCESAVITANDAVEIAERAASVQFDEAEAAGGTAAPMHHSHQLLLSIAASLRTDGDGTPTPPRSATIL